MGTLRYGRGGPKDLKKIALTINSGEKETFIKGNMMLMLWHDKKVVKTLSTIQNSNFIVSEYDFLNEPIYKPKI